MNYQGGKYWYVKKILPFFGAAKVFEPFAGGANVTVHLPPGSICGDVDPCVIRLYQTVQKFGVDWICDIGEAQYAALKATNNPSDPWTAIAKYGLSFGGKPWGGFARCKTDSRATRGYAPALRRSLAPLFKKVVGFYSHDMLDIQPQPLPGFVAYFDPPYLGTLGYKLTFDYSRFISRCLEWAERLPVFVSEYQPLHSSWKLVADFPKNTEGLRRADAKTEKLFRVVG